MAFSDLTIKNNLSILAPDTPQTTTPIAAAQPAVLPLVQTTPATVPATTPTPAATPSTTPASAVTNPIPLGKTPTAEDKNMGLSVEKNTTQKQETKKTGESVGERMNRYFPKKYAKASREEKKQLFEQYITKHYASLKDKSRSEQIKIQLADFEKLISNTKNPDDYQMIAEKIDVLQKENQVAAAKSATVEQSSPTLRARGEIGISKAAHKCDAENQEELNQMVANSKNLNAIKIGAGYAAECADSKQVNIVKTYQNLDNVEVNKVLINQYGKYAKENEVGIHTIMSKSKHSETVEYAASNIWHFDKMNQAQAVQITSNTGNEKAINAAAAQYDKYDQSAREAVKRIINDSPYESAKDTLCEAEETADAEDETNDVEDSEEEATSSNEFKDILKSNSLNTDTLIREACKNNPDQVANWIDTLTPSELSNVIGAIPLSELPSDVFTKVAKLMESADRSSQKEFVDNAQATSSYNAIDTNLGVLGANIQNIYMQKAIRMGKTVDKNLLSLSVRQDYNKQLKEQNKV